MGPSFLEEVTDLRSIWKNEARDFTPWLAQPDNISVLSQKLDIDINLCDTEVSAKGKWVDMFATEIGTEKHIIIENQLENSDADHQSRLLTYAFTKNAKYVVWIVKHAKEEHRMNIEFLNSISDGNVKFFLCEIKVYRLGEKIYADYDVIKKPKGWGEERKTYLKDLRLEYWRNYLEYISTDSKFLDRFRVQSASTNFYLNHYVGKSVFHMSVDLVNKSNALYAEIYINDDKEFFQKLLSHKDEIEKKVGMELVWSPLDDRKASRIKAVKNVENFEKRKDWNEQFEWIKETIGKLYLAVKPFTFPSSSLNVGNFRS